MLATVTPPIPQPPAVTTGSGADTGTGTVPSAGLQEPTTGATVSAQGPAAVSTQSQGRATTDQPSAKGPHAVPQRASSTVVTPPGEEPLQAAEAANLAHTGAGDAGILAGLATALLAAGAGLVAAARTREEDEADGEAPAQ